MQDRTLSIDPLMDEDVVPAVPEWSEVRPLPKATAPRVASISSLGNSKQGFGLWHNGFCCGPSCGPRVPGCLEDDPFGTFATIRVEALPAIHTTHEWDDPGPMPERILTPRQDAAEEANLEAELFQACDLPELDPDEALQLKLMQDEMLLLQERGELQKAADLGERLLKLRELKQGPAHSDFLRLTSSLGNVYQGLGMLDKAEKLYQQVLHGFDTTLGSDHIATLRAVNDIACILEAKGKHRAAERLSRLLLERLTKVQGPSHPDTADRKSVV